MEPYHDSQIIPLPTGDAGVALTLSHLRQFVSISQTSELAHAAVQDALAGTPEKNAGAEAAAIVGWIRQRYHYIQDPVEVELVHDPRYLLRQIDRQGFFMGDCDDASVLLATLLETAGYPTRFVVQGDSGESYAHVLVEAQLDGTWTPIDLTNRSATVGWKPSGVGREARERRLTMLGQDFMEEGVAEFATAEQSAAIQAAQSAAPVSAGDVTSWLTSVLTPALSIAERMGLYKPVVGYDSYGKPIYGTTLPATGTQAAYTSLTQTVAGVPTWLWLVGGAAVLLVVLPGRRRRR